jgi:hypothetical protein
MSAIAGNIRTSSSACRAVPCRAVPGPALRACPCPAPHCAPAVPRGTHGAAARAAAAAAQRWRCAKAESFAFGCESLGRPSEVRGGAVCACVQACVQACACVQAYVQACA